MKNITINAVSDKNVYWENIQPLQPDGFKEQSLSELQSLKNSILKNGFHDPFDIFVLNATPDTIEKMILDGSNILSIDGVHRKKALLELKKEGYIIPDLLPCNYIFAKDMQQAAQIVLSRNVSHSHITDANMLIEQFGVPLEDLKYILPEKYISTWNINEEVKDISEENDYSETTSTAYIMKTDIKLGDIFNIGNHVLLCGDSTNGEHVEKLLIGKKAELLFTSPPYSDMRTYNNYGETDTKNLDVDDLSKFISCYYPYCNYCAVNLGLQIKNRNIYPYWDSYINEAKNVGYDFLAWNVWNRFNPKTMAQQMQFIPISHEWIFVFGKGYKDINKTVICETAGKKNRGGIRRENDNMYIREYEVNTHKKINSVTSLDAQTATGGIHPAMFPISFPKEYIEALTEKNNIVVEPFCGSGTTIIACEQLNRICYSMELEPMYIEKSIIRILGIFENITILKNGIDVTEQYKTFS